MKDGYSSTKTVATLAPATRTNGTATGTTVDRVGGGACFQDATVVVFTGTVTDGTHTVVVEHSDNGTDWAAVDDSLLQGTEPAIGSSDDDKVYEIGYRGTKRYLRVVVTTAGASTGGVVGAVVVLGKPRVAPVNP